MLALGVVVELHIGGEHGHPYRTVGVGDVAEDAMAVGSPRALAWVTSLWSRRGLPMGLGGGAPDADPPVGRPGLEVVPAEGVGMLGCELAAQRFGVVVVDQLEMLAGASPLKLEKISSWWRRGDRGRTSSTPSSAVAA